MYFRVVPPNTDQCYSPNGFTSGSWPFQEGATTKQRAQRALLEAGSDPAPAPQCHDPGHRCRELDDDCCSGKCFMWVCLP